MIQSPDGESISKNVIEAIEKMISTLEDEEKQDRGHEEECEKDRMEKTRDAAFDRHAIDELTDSIIKLTGEITERKASIVERNGSRTHGS